MPPVNVSDKLVFRVHAIERMFLRGVSEDAVRHVLKTGKVVEDYPNDTPYPSCLLLGWWQGKPLHLVVAQNRQDGENIIITAYQPDEAQWEPGFEGRKKR